MNRPKRASVSSEVWQASQIRSASTQSSATSSSVSILAPSLQLHSLDAFLQPRRSDLRVDLRGEEGGVPQELLNGPHVASCGLVEQRGGRVPQHVRVEALNAHGLANVADDLLGGGFGQGPARVEGRGEDPLRRLAKGTPISQWWHQLGMDRNLALLLTFP